MFKVKFYFSDDTMIVKFRTLYELQLWLDVAIKISYPRLQGCIFL